jgi:hypothetical protein
LNDRTVQSNMRGMLKNKMTEPFGHGYVIKYSGRCDFTATLGCRHTRRRKYQHGDK